MKVFIVTKNEQAFWDRLLPVLATADTIRLTGELRSGCIVSVVADDMKTLKGQRCDVLLSDSRDILEAFGWLSPIAAQLNPSDIVDGLSI